jgi:hypothetical protein
MKKTAAHCAHIVGIFLLLLLLSGPSSLVAEGGDDPATRELVWAKAYDDIGTFDGWSFWVGFEASFSETYAPESESYAWIVHFAPEGVYLSLQKGKAVYSAVDVNASFNYFYGLVQSPDKDRITKDFFNSTNNVTFSVNSFSTNAAGVGPLSNLSASISSSISFFRIGTSSTFVRAVQFGAGPSVAYALVNIPLPFSVSLATESSVEAGFYPICRWGAGKTHDPVADMLQGLQSLASNPGGSFIDVNLTYMSKTIQNCLQRFPLSGKVKEFIASRGGDSEIDRLIDQVTRWKESGDTKTLPDKLRPNIPPAQLYPLMKSLHSAVNAGFEAGYKRGQDGKGRTDTVYADCLQEMKAQTGRTITVEVTAVEISALVPGLDPAKLEGLPVIFDNPPDAYLSSKATESRVPIKKGKAVFQFIVSTPTPILMGARVERSAKTKNKNLELCRRLIEF